jgi:hypothetical protein
LIPFVLFGYLISPNAQSISESVAVISENAITAMSAVAILLLIFVPFVFSASVPCFYFGGGLLKSATISQIFFRGRVAWAGHGENFGSELAGDSGGFFWFWRGSFLPAIMAKIFGGGLGSGANFWGCDFRPAGSFFSGGGHAAESGFFWHGSPWAGHFQKPEPRTEPRTEPAGTESP